MSQAEQATQLKVETERGDLQLNLPLDIRCPTL
jgi:hypothetical protein